MLRKKLSISLLKIVLVAGILLKSKNVPLYNQNVNNEFQKDACRTNDIE